MLDRHPNHVRLFYSKDDQGVARVTPKQLLECCLRMKPDRILLAELRAEEAFDYLRNVNSGHPGSITSVHAASAELAFEQLVLLVKQNPGGRELARDDIKSLLYLLIDVVIQFGVESHERFIKEIWYDPERKRRMPCRRSAGMLEALTHGWPGVALAYAAVQVPMFVGLVRARRPVAALPAVAGPRGTARAVAGVGVALAGPLLSHLGASPGGGGVRARRNAQRMLGYAGGRVLAEEPARQKHQRGAVVRDGPRAEVESRRALGTDHAGGPSGPGARRDQAFQADRHHRNRQKHGDPGDAGIRARRAAIARSSPIRTPAICGDSIDPARGDVVLNPFDERSVKWDLFAEIKTPTTSNSWRAP